ncbi:MAG: lysophospholipid acyltransferase family protein [Legionella sp.]|nr:lysophospholipid acyltransferase family protein [Legionella sp.]
MNYSVQNSIPNLRVSLWGWLIYFCLPIRKKTVHKNIDFVFQKTITIHAKKRLAQAFYSHLVTSIKELISIPFIRRDKLRLMVVIEGMSNLTQGIASGRGVILLTGHVGNWEFAPIMGIPMMNITNNLYVIRKPIKTRWIESWLYKRCETAGITILSARQGIKQLRTVLAQNGIIHFAFDQHVGIRTNQGIAVPFFNELAGTYRSLAVLAHRTGATVVPMSTFRLNNGKHVLKFHAPLEWQEGTSLKESIYNNTLHYNQMIEAMILDNPEQWWWVHKRWKLPKSVEAQTAGNVLQEKT